MARFFVAVLLLGLSSCISGAPGTTASTSPQSQIRSQLSGNWINELSSTMTVIADQNGGLSISVGWVVTYNNEQCNAHSTATWSGQYFNNISGEMIQAPRIFCSGRYNFAFRRQI
ncbi:uncharacterized protein C8R40DRAFT_1071618 [Lentinula edodes]|uniref:uncharacterized protein n=1 Tax=Lentinula edodes TaxID=5353 RepID=UPI001E8DD0C3|nr:uncharacterized protein C8R40DRAFT_1071618 [Lentinula edodes]KAH7872700.1 hypothetical protein C8R40DRAFT_1071618 [Lentinula edodes]